MGTTLSLAGCLGFSFGLVQSKIWMTFPDYEGMNEALELIPEVGPYSSIGIYDFIPISSETYRRSSKERMLSAEDREWTIERYLNSKKLTSFSQIIEEFNSYNLPCLEDKNKLTCEYYAVYSRVLPGRTYYAIYFGDPGNAEGDYYSHDRRDRYTVISLSFELLDNQLKVGYDDQSCAVVYVDNRIINYAQIPGYKNGKKIDAEIEECLSSDLYKKIQDYFKTYYPEKYTKAHLGGTDNE